MDSETRFRQIFFTHLKSDGLSEAEAFQLMFKTPAHFHHPPSDEHGLDLLEAFRSHYQNQLPYSWYFEGLHKKTAPDEMALKAPSRPVTFIVVPGIFGEFIDQLPFQSIVEKQDSHFPRKWRHALEQVGDETYSLFDLGHVPRTLDQLVKIGSMDQGKRTFCNVIVLRAECGSLETLGSLESNVEVYKRRLEKTFDVIDEDTNIYLVGYSRGLAVALDLVSTLHEERKTGQISSASRAWFDKLKGVVGLGGVFYGAKFAEHVLNGEAGVTSDLVTLMRDSFEELQTVPDQAGRKEKSRIVSHNITVRSKLLKQILKAERGEEAVGRPFLKTDLQDVFAKERRFRMRSHQFSSPNASGIFALVNNFFRNTFQLRSYASSYNTHILARKKLISAVIEGVQVLTPESRDAWWLTHELPKDLLIFSLTGTMPDSFLNDFYSPLWSFEGYGPKSSDYNIALRSSYYDVTVSENTQINDSQVSHFASRYWEQMYPGHRYKHYYLGVLGTHHWGMAFPFMIEDDRGNTFPRAILLKSVASFISSLDREAGQ